MENVIHPQQSKLWGTRSFERVVPLEILVNKNINSKVELQLIKGFSCITSKKRVKTLSVMAISILWKVLTSPRP